VEAVKRIRQEQGLSQQALAKKADVNKVTLIRIESGKGNPNIETLEKLADALGVELSDFFPKAQASLFQPEEEQRRTQDAKPPPVTVPLGAQELSGATPEVSIKLARASLERALQLVDAGQVEAAAEEAEKARRILTEAA
jgi:transcriptional regulator with XRE-family HTH domain